MPVNLSTDETVVSVEDCECGRSDCHRLRLVIQDEGKEPVVRYVPLDQVQKISVHLEGWLYRRDQDPPITVGVLEEGMYRICRLTGKFGDLVERRVPTDRARATIGEFLAAHQKEFGPPPHGQ